MALREILKFGAETLRKKSKHVGQIDRRTHQLLDDMAETMYAANGVGLAAPQVGILKRVVVLDVGDGLLELINPEFLSSSGEQIDEEGCLSGNGEKLPVKRPAQVRVKAVNRAGKGIVIDGEGLLARALCHEIDHLEGILFIDKALPPSEMPQEAP
ncbi:MAG: peptide deformylase [Christensenellaceae bacterium]|nr:peptide deformylase [Christensenellaceae bacterium]